MKLIEGGVPREGCQIYSAEGQKIGHLTSGAFSATLKKGIGMGYVELEFKNPGTEVFVDIRGRKVKAAIEKSPLVPTHYYNSESK